MVKRCVAAGGMGKTPPGTEWTPAAKNQHTSNGENKSRRCLELLGRLKSVSKGNRPEMCSG